MSQAENYGGRTNDVDGRLSILKVVQRVYNTLDNRGHIYFEGMAVYFSQRKGNRSLLQYIREGETLKNLRLDECFCSMSRDFVFLWAPILQQSRNVSMHPLILLCFISRLIVGVANVNGVKPRAGPAFPLQGPTAHPAQTIHRARKPR